MYTRIDRAHRFIPVVLGSMSLFGSILLCFWNLLPNIFTPKEHILLEGFVLVLIALAYLIYQSAHRPPFKEWVKATMLVVAFFLWAAVQVCPDAKLCSVFNDTSIALFVLDVFLVMVGWPDTSPDESFAESVETEP